MSHSHLLQKLDRSVQIERLSSGLTLVHVPLGEHDQRFYLGATIKAGARYEPSRQPGVAHFLEHMMFRGSKRYPNARKLAKAFEWFGGEWNAATGYEHTEYWYSGTIAGHDELIPLFADFFCNPCMNDIEAERDVIRKELQKETNEYGSLTDLDFHTYHYFFPNTSLDRSILGSENSLSGIRKKDLQAYRKQHYHPSQIVICAVGGQTGEDILSLLRQSFRSYRSRSTQQRKPLHAIKKGKLGPKINWIRHPDNEYQLQLSFKCGPEWGKDQQALELVARILADGYSSRLGHRLRESLGLVYTIDAQANLMHDVGTLDIYSSVGATELPRFLKETLLILRKLKDKPLSKSELELWRRRAAADVDLLASQPESLGYRISWALLSGQPSSLSQMRAVIEQIDAATIQSLCNRVFQAKNCALTLLGPDDPRLQKRLEDILVSF